MYHVIHQSTWDYYCLFGVDGELPNSFKKTDLSNLWKYHIPSSFFFLSSGPMTLVSFLFLPCSEVCPPRVCTLSSFWSINSSQYHVIVMWLYFRFLSERAKLNCVTHSVKFEYWYLKKLSMIRNKVVCDKHYNSNRLTVRNIFLFCYSRFRLMCIFKVGKI